MNIPKWLEEMRTRAFLEADSLESEEAGYWAEWGFNYCAKILLTETRRVQNLNRELTQMMVEMKKQQIEKAINNGKSSD